MEKQRRLKVIILSTLIIGVLTISVAFSAISRTLKIGGVGKMDTAKWDVRFENLREPEITRDAVQISEPKIMDDGGVVGDINVKLTKPKDEISYKVDIANNGTIDAEVNVMTIADLTDEQKKLIDFGVYYLGGAKITKYDLLEAGEKKTIIIKIRYKDDITEFDLPSEPLEIKLSCQIDYIQSDAQMVITPNGNLEKVESVLAEEEDSYYRKIFNGQIYNNAVESITFLSTLKVPKDAQETAWDASLNKDGSVVAWYTDSDSNDLYEVYIGGNGKVYAPENCSYLFYGFIKLKEINFNGNFDTSNVKNMNYMFAYCNLITNLDLSLFDTSKVISMDNMFLSNKSLLFVDLSSFNTSNVTIMSSLFSGCQALINLELSNFNTSNVTTMKYMFNDCSALINLDLSNFDTSNVIGMGFMFSGCSSIKNINLSSFDTSNVSSMKFMFSNCQVLENINLSNFDTSNVIEMDYMFSKCKSLIKLDLSSFDTSKVTTMMSTFQGCLLLKDLYMNKASFNSPLPSYMMFDSVPEGINIYVKDEDAKTFILSKKSDANVIIVAPVAYKNDSLNYHFLLL